MRLYQGVIAQLNFVAEALVQSYCNGTCLSVQQLWLRSPSSLYLKADAVEKSHRVLLLVDFAELPHDFLGPCFKRTHAQSKHKFSRSHSSKYFKRGAIKIK